MTVYVDDMRRQVLIEAVQWSHLFATTSQELHEFAARLDQKREWVEAEGTIREHYLLTEPERIAAIAAGAVPISYPRGVGLLLAARRRRVVTDKESDR
ncbi:DUF4031 domain-containing protein [Kribbella sp. NPDC051137]|uniref:DUF4031 domain-containing protein n=1 Tax=Kribbella sp. NPDC051137 TaxID=3155045 RepID=UPI003433A7F8